MTRPLRTVAALIAWVALGALAPAALSAPPQPGGWTTYPPHQPETRPAPPPETPRNAAVVAGPTPSGAQLVVFDRKRRLCGDVRRARDDYPMGDCTRPTGRLRSPFLQTEFDGRGRRAWHWGFVAPEVAAVEVVMRGGLRVTVPAEAGSAYTGRYAGRVRFFVAEGRGERGQEARYVKLLAADGSVLAVVEHFFGDSVRVGRSVELARGGSAPGRWSLRAFRRRALAPLPGNEERFAEQDCVELRPERGRPLGEVCAHRDFPRQLSAFSEDQACRPVGSVALGLVGPDVRAVRATLGDGRIRGLRLRRLPARYGPRRVFALVLGPQVAVRRIVAVDREGRRETVRAGVPPGVARCGDSGSLIVSYAYHTPKPAGPLAFTVYDDGVLLCATLGRPAPSSDCGYPPLHDDDARILVRRAGARTLIAGVLPLQAATAVVELVGGERRRLETTTEGPYAGRYRGMVRFFVLDLPGRRTLRSVRVLDDRGRRIHVQPGDLRARALTRPRLLVPGPGGIALRGRLLRIDPSGTDYPCIWLAGGGQGLGCGFPTTGFANLSATCSPRRLFVWGLLRGGSTAVTVETDRGPVRARVVRLPRSLWQRGTRSAFLAVLPAAAAPRALVVSAQSERRRRLSLPPAARQCGYETFLSL